ncbi:MAG: hypothetical protein WCZ87_04975 [Thiohalobacteraceae bacterium]
MSLVVCSGAILSLAGAPGAAQAQSLAELAARIEGLQQELQAQRSLIEDQAVRIGEQREEIRRLQEQALAAGALSDLRAAGIPGGAEAEARAAASAPLPERPVGEEPALARVEQQVQAVPEGSGVLTPPGRFVFEPSLELTNTSNNRLVFRGIELVVGLPLGVIEASDVDRNSVVAAAALRYGLAKNLEIEARVPFMYRSDRFSVSQLRTVDEVSQVVRELSYSEKHIGDIEFAVRYQFNRPIGQRPIFVGSLRVKSTTGKSPYSLPFDEFAIPIGLPTGSGFWGIQPGINFLLPTDPAVIYGGASYLYHMPKTIGRRVGDVRIGRVDPGDAINANIGFGFALNPRFSFSLGYRHTFILPTTTQLGDTTQRSNSLQSGSLSLGMSYRLTQKQSVNLGIDIGATADAPSVSVSLRVPFTP